MIGKLSLILLLGLLINIDQENRIDYSYLKGSTIKNLSESTKTESRTNKGVFVNIGKIISMESSGDPLAYNEYSEARGLMQITPIVLEEWNQFNSSQQHTLEDLFNPEINKKIGTWYLGRIKNHYLPHYGLEETIENILIAYNHGIVNLSKMENEKDFDSLPLETREYIEKYKE